MWIAAEQDVVGVADPAPGIANDGVLDKVEVGPSPRYAARGSPKNLRNLLGWRLARSLPSLFAAGLIGSREGRVVVESWSRWQSGSGLDRTSAARQKRFRERHRGEVTALRNGVTAEDVERVTNGGPPLTGVSNATVTPPREAVVTLTKEELLAARRSMARSIREAPDAMRDRYLATFERKFSTDPPDHREQRNRRRFHPSMTPILRESWEVAS